MNGGEIRRHRRNQVQIPPFGKGAVIGAAQCPAPPLPTQPNKPEADDYLTVDTTVALQLDDHHFAASQADSNVRVRFALPRTVKSHLWSVRLRVSSCFGCGRGVHAPSVSTACESSPSCRLACSQGARRWRLSAFSHAYAQDRLDARAAAAAPMLLLLHVHKQGINLLDPCPSSFPQDPRHHAMTASAHKAMTRQ